MNERIRLLASQCYITGPIGPDGWPEYSRIDEEKFAELIIAECCVGLHPMLRDMISRTQGVDMIVKHFRIDSMTDESALPVQQQSLVYRLRRRAEIRRQIPDRQSAKENRPDRIADLLDEAADEIVRLQAESE